MVSSVARPCVSPSIPYPLHRADVTQRSHQVAGAVLKGLGTIPDRRLAYGIADFDIEAGDDSALNGVIAVRCQGSAHQHQPVPALTAAQAQVAGNDQDPLAIAGKIDVSIDSNDRPVVELGRHRPGRIEKVVRQRGAGSDPGPIDVDLILGGAPYA